MGCRDLPAGDRNPHPRTARPLRKRPRHELSRKPDADPDEASRLVRAVNPFLGWICCISVVRHDDKTGQTGSPVSFTAESPGQEAALLTAFWERVRVYNGFDKWVTFNGKKFDVEYVVTRSLACGVPVANRRLLETYPFRQEGHVDLKCLWQRRGVSFADGAPLGVPSPKSDMDGSQVYPAILTERSTESAPTAKPTPSQPSPATSKSAASPLPTSAESCPHLTSHSAKSSTPKEATPTTRYDLR